MEEKTALIAQVVWLHMLYFETTAEVSKSIQIIVLVRNYFSQNNVTSGGAVSHNVLYYQQLSVAHYQVIFNANNFLEL